MNTTGQTATAIRPFHVEVSDEQIGDLRRRIAATRWPSKELVADRSQGVQLAALQAFDASLQANTASLAAAVQQNTPSGPVTPGASGRPTPPRRGLLQSRSCTARRRPLALR